MTTKARGILSRPFGSMAHRALPWLFFLIIWPPAVHLLLGQLVQPIAVELQGSAPDASQRPCFNDNCDFIPFWTAGKLADGGQTASIYDSKTFLRWEQQNLYGGTAPNLLYFYPPPALLVSYPFGYFQFQEGFLLWSVILTGAGIAALRYAGLSWFIVVSGLVSAPALASLRLGQLGFFVGAVLTAGIFSIETRPRRAAGLLGLLVIKPQAGLLVPVVLLARREWTALLVGAAVVAVLCGAVTLLLGVDVWRDYFLLGTNSMRQVLLGPVNSTGISVLWALPTFGFPLHACYAGQAITAIFAVAACFYGWRLPHADRRSRTALTIFLTLLISPYGYIADMCGYAMAVAMLAEASGQVTLLDMLLWLAPIIGINIGNEFHLIIVPIFVLIAIIYVFISIHKRAAAANA